MLRSKKEVGEETFVEDESLQAEGRRTAHQCRFYAANNGGSESGSPELRDERIELDELGRVPWLLNALHVGATDPVGNATKENGALDAGGEGRGVLGWMVREEILAVGVLRGVGRGLLRRRGKSGESTHVRGRM
jgi:hypothetical protein